jgi:hypothetical protein
MIDIQGGTMTLIQVGKPNQCTICGYYLTTGEEYAGHRCLDPGHWQAAGLLSPNDFYPMAIITARASIEFNLRLANQHRSE